MTLRFTNSALLGLLMILTLTGVSALIVTLEPWIMTLHRWAAWALIALIPWKVGISLRSLGRGLGRRSRRLPIISLSLLLAAGAVLVIGLGLLWAWRLEGEWTLQGFTAVNLHWLAGLFLSVPLALHIWKRWPHPRRQDLISRRAALKAAGLGLAGLAGGWLADRLAAERALAAHPRRFTGSRESASFLGNAHPVTTNPGHGSPELDVDTWRLHVLGEVESPISIGYRDLFQMEAEEVAATLDCTVGWFTQQRWQGVPLRSLLAEARPRTEARWVRLRASSGYTKDFTLIEAENILLATHVEGEALSHAHGYPLRAVVPFRRGWFWVKWIREIEILPFRAT